MESLKRKLKVRFNGRSLFGRKVNNLKELKELIDEAKKDGLKGSAYIVAKDIKLNNIGFKAFADNFFNDQPWISKEDGRVDDEGRLVCIRVKNIDTGEKVLVDSEGTHIQDIHLLKLSFYIGFVRACVAIFTGRWG